MVKFPISLTTDRTAFIIGTLSPPRVFQDVANDRAACNIREAAPIVPGPMLSMNLPTPREASAYSPEFIIYVVP